MEFGNLGKHCSELTCRQKDFLPFECKYCKNMYCLDHRAPKDHQCLNENIGAKKAIVCPMCAQTLKYKFGEDENEIWTQHFSADCPETISKQKLSSQNKKCFLRTCNSKILTINTYFCRKCGYEFCLKHRYEDSHDCKANLLLKRENIYLNQTKMKENIEKKVDARLSNSQPAQNLEFCEFCGKSFHTISELISHTEKIHIFGSLNRDHPYTKRFLLYLENNIVLYA